SKCLKPFFWQQSLLSTDYLNLKVRSVVKEGSHFVIHFKSVIHCIHADPGIHSGLYNIDLKARPAGKLFNIFFEKLNQVFIHRSRVNIDHQLSGKLWLDAFKQHYFFDLKLKFCLAETLTEKSRNKKIVSFFQIIGIPGVILTPEQELRFT